MMDIKAVVTLGGFPGAAPISLYEVQLEPFRSFPEGVNLTEKEWILRALLVATNFSDGLPVISILELT
jgi:hypothetical protein